MRQGTAGRVKSPKLLTQKLKSGGSYPLLVYILCITNLYSRGFGTQVESNKNSKRFFTQSGGSLTHSHSGGIKYITNESKWYRLCPVPFLLPPGVHKRPHQP